MLDEDFRGNAEAPGKPLDLSHVQVSLPSQNLGYDALAPNLGKIRLPDVVLAHEVLQHGGGLCFRKRHMFRLVLFDENTERVGELRKRVFLCFADFVDDLIQRVNGALVVLLRT